MGKMEARAKAQIQEYIASKGAEFSAGLISFQAHLEPQRSRFLHEFGPARLATLTLEELATTIPFNVSQDHPMDAWLESRADSTFNTHLFGDIAGGSALKFGTQQERTTGSWRARLRGKKRASKVTSEDALEILEDRRSELLATSEFFDQMSLPALLEMSPSDLQEQLETLAPNWYASAWLHKYLHLVNPLLVTHHATLSSSRAVCCRLGLLPSGGGFADKLQLLQFANELSGLPEVPLALRCRLFDTLQPRRRWLLRRDEKSRSLSLNMSSHRQEGAHKGFIELGPDALGDLQPLLTPRRDLSKRLKAALREAGLAKNRDLLRSLTRMLSTASSGDLIAILGENGDALAVGELMDGYTFEAGSPHPHRRAVSWQHRVVFSLPETEKLDQHTLMSIPAEHLAAIALETSLWVHGQALDEITAPKGERLFEEPPKASPAVVLDGEGSSEATLHVLPDSLSALFSQEEDEEEEIISFSAVDIYYEEPLFAPPEEVPLHLEETTREIVEMLLRKGQVILYGPPGTGKTHHAERAAQAMIEHYNPPQHRALQTHLTFCTFHPAFSYEDFVEGYRPDGEGGFVLRPGVLLQLARAAEEAPNEVFVLLIDEINRGNLPRIFGELITLLEHSRRGKTEATLPLSGARLSIPPNLYLIGTMNTADRSILLLDTALRRRFGFKELMPNPDTLAGHAIEGLSLSAWLRAINRRLLRSLGREARDLQIGHAYLMHQSEPIQTIKQLRAVLKEDLWPLLQEYCYEDPQALSTILSGSDSSHSSRGLYDPNKDRLRSELFVDNEEANKRFIQAMQALIAEADQEKRAMHP